MRKVWASWLQ